jgi:hypothetical protein
MSKDFYVDVDIHDTIVRSAGLRRIPIPRIIKPVRASKAQGAVLLCWCAGGAEYAKRSAQEFGIADCFLAYLPKPSILIDDHEVTAWPRVIQVHPSGCSQRTLDDYSAELER